MKRRKAEYCYDTYAICSYLLQLVELIMAWFTRLAHPVLAVHVARLTGTRSLASSTTTAAAQAKILRVERERAAPQSQSEREVNYDGPYSAPEMKTAMPGPKSRVL